MATLNASKPFNAENVYDFTMTSHSGTSTQRTFFGAGGDKMVISGSGITVGKDGSDFYPDLPEGTLTTIAMYKAGVLQWTLKGFPWNDNVDVWSEGYYLGSNIGTVYGMEAEIAWNLRYNDTINGSSGNDKLRGYNGNDTVKGNAGNDHVAGNAGNDKLYGGDGNDLVKGGGGTNTVDGGAGSDTTSYDWMTKGAKVSLAVKTAQTVASASAVDTLVSIENLEGSNYADTLTGSSVANLIKGLSGNDIISTGSGNDTLIGGDGPDRHPRATPWIRPVEEPAPGVHKLPAHRIEIVAQLLFTHLRHDGIFVDTVVLEALGAAEGLIRTGAPLSLRVERPNPELLGACSEAILELWAERREVVRLDVVVQGDDVRAEMTNGSSRVVLDIAEAAGLP